MYRKSNQALQIDYDHPVGQLVLADWRIDERGGNFFKANHPKYDLSESGAGSGNREFDGYAFDGSVAEKIFTSPDVLPQVTGSDYTFLIAFRSTDSVADWHHMVSCRDTGGGPDNHSIELNTGNIWLWQTLEFIGFNGVAPTNTPVDDGKTHVVCICRAGGAPEIAVDGKNVAVTTSGTWANPVESVTNSFAIGGPTYGAGPASRDTTVMSYTIFDQAIPDFEGLSADPEQFFLSDSRPIVFLPSAPVSASGAATISGLASVSSSGQKGVSRSASLDVIGEVLTASQKGVATSVIVEGMTQIAVTSTHSRSGSATIEQLAQMAAIGASARSSDAVITAVADLVPTATTARSADITITATAELSNTAPLPSASGSAQVGAVADITAAGAKGALSSVTLRSAAEVTTIGTAGRIGAGSITGAADTGAPAHTTDRQVAALLNTAAEIAAQSSSARSGAGAVSVVVQIGLVTIAGAPADVKRITDLSGVFGAIDSLTGVFQDYRTDD